MKLPHLFALLFAILLAAACSWQVKSVTTDTGKLRIEFVDVPPIPTIAPQIASNEASLLPTITPEVSE